MTLPPDSPESAYHELCAYTLTHGDPAFLHQHVVDAWAAQRTAPGNKPIHLTMALVGLYLHVEKGWTGRQAQLAHLRLAQRRRVWPTWIVPEERGAMTAADVMATPPGPGRDRAIHAWAETVWRAFAGNRDTVVTLLREGGVLGGP